MHSTPQEAEKHLPWVRCGLQCLASMLRNGQYQGQISMTMSAIHQMLIAVFPGMSAAVGPDVLSTDNTHHESNIYNREVNDTRRHLDGTGDSGTHGYGLTGGNAISNPQTAGEPIAISRPSTTPTSRDAQQQQQQQPQQNKPLNQIYGSPVDFNSNNPSAFFSSLGQNLNATPVSSSDTNNANSSSNMESDNMVDFTQAELMSWKDLDFSTMDLEAFMSIDPSAASAGNPASSGNNHNPFFPPVFSGNNNNNNGWGGNDMGVGYGNTR